MLAKAGYPSPEPPVADGIHKLHCANMSETWFGPALRPAMQIKMQPDRPD